jgi:hypothetical protein
MKQESFNGTLQHVMPFEQEATIGTAQRLLSILLYTRESILEGGQTVYLVDEGACCIGGVRTMTKLEERSIPVARPSARAAEPQARVAMRKNAVFPNSMAKATLLTPPSHQTHRVQFCS